MYGCAEARQALPYRLARADPANPSAPLPGRGWRDCASWSGKPETFGGEPGPKSQRDAFFGNAVFQHMIQHEHQGSRRHISIGVQHSRSEEHTSELQSLMRTSYAVFCLKK